VNSYIVKPVDFEKFLETVSKVGFYWSLMNKIPPHHSWSNCLARGVWTSHLL